MRVLLTSNASYAPPKGGSTRSNLVWLRHLARSGHECHVVSAADGGMPDSTVLDLPKLSIFAVRQLTRRADVLRHHILDFRPDWVLVSSEDVSHILLREAAECAPGRLVYLAHTPQFYPFGPASWNLDVEATGIVRQARSVVAIAHYTADYIAEHCGRAAVVIHPPIYGEPPFPRFGSFDSGAVLMINPSVVKGVGIFLALAKLFPQIEFAGLAGWATTSRDRQEMSALPNVTVLDSVPAIDDVLRSARLLLMPSIWHEGFGLIAMEAMLRGLPVIASNAGGLVEAKRGTGYIVPVKPIESFKPVFDETHMPQAVELPQDIGPWASALHTLLTNRREYLAESERSREAGLQFVSALRVEDFESLLLSLTPEESLPNMPAKVDSKLQDLSAVKRALLMQRLRKREEH